MTILVVGGTGGVGKALVQELLSKGETVRASSRQPEPAGMPKGAHPVMMDLDRPETLPLALKGIKKAFLYARGTEADTFVKAAKAAGVQHIVLLSSSAVTENDADDFNRQRHEVVEQAIIQSGLDWTFLRPGAFASNALHWARQIRFGDSLRFPYPKAQQAPIHEADIAAVAAVALTTRFLTGEAPYLTGPQSLSQEAQLQAIAVAIGRPLRYDALTHEGAIDFLGQFIPRQFLDIVLDGLAKQDGVVAPISPAVEQITWKPARSFAQWAQEHRADFL